MSGAGPVAVDEALLRRWPLPRPDAEGDKETRGETVVVAGSREMPGAAWLAAIAALRAGAGKLVVATAAGVARGLALRLPEARVIGLPETPLGGLAPEGAPALAEVLAAADALLIGPGLQDAAGSLALVRACVAGAVKAGVVLDAAAMDAAGATRFARMPLLTPHAGEMAHLSGLDKDEVVREPERTALAMAKRWHAVVALKGARTVIAAPDGRLWRHDGGSVGLATSGSGDTLAGIAAGLAARGAPLEQAAVWAVALHARAGDALARRIGPLGYLASELPGEIPQLMHRLAGREGASDG